MVTSVRSVQAFFLTTLMALTCAATLLHAASSGSGKASTLQAAQPQQTGQGAEDPLQRPRAEQKNKSASSKAENARYRRWADDEVKWIITAEEREAFKRLGTNAERDRFIEQFWQRRGPTPDTEENEYKDEYYRRVAYANERYSAGIPGRNTDRGHIYIVFGPPDSMESSPMGGPYLRPAEEGGGQTVAYPFERWRYRHLEGIDEEVEILFVDQCGCGEYKRTINRGDIDAMLHVPGAGLTDLEAMGRANKADRLRGGVETLGASFFNTNLDSKEFDRIALDAKLDVPPPVKFRDLHEEVTHILRTNLLLFDVHVDYVRLTPSSVLVPVTIQVANRELSYVGQDGVQRASLNIYGRMTTLTGKVVQSFDEAVHVGVPADLLPKFVDNVSLYQKAVPVPPGHYRLDVILKDINGNKLGAYGRSIVVPDFGADGKLASSSLIVADVMERVPSSEVGTGSFVIGADKVRPRVEPSSGQPPVFKRNQKVNLWMQVYNLATDTQTRKPSATVEYQVIDTATRKPVLALSLSSGEMAGAASERTLKLSLPAGQFGHGVYEVTIKVNDLISRQSIAPVAKFAIE